MDSEQICYSDKMVEGYHMLSGVEYYFNDDHMNEKPYDYDKDVVNHLFGSWSSPEGIVRFCLDGIVFEAYYDPEDGYRSSMTNLVMSDKPIKNSFPPQPVFVKCFDYDPHENPAAKHFDINDKNLHPQDIDLHPITDEQVLCIYNLKSAFYPESNMILKVGTNHEDSYYPCAICEYHPENLPINLNKDVDKLLS